MSEREPPDAPPTRPRRRFQFSLRTLMIVVLTYGLLWTLTATWGEAHAYQLARGVYDNDPKFFGRRLDRDPWPQGYNKGPPAPRGPWHYVETFSPAPFLVRARIVVDSGSSGWIFEYWAFWFFGYEYRFHESPYIHWD
jgi:hypothetical protein